MVRSSLLAVVLATTSGLVPLAGLCLPVGGVVSGGRVTIGTPREGVLGLSQGTNRAAIDWSSFNIGKGERVDVRQPSASSVLLNRIHDQQPSQIYGALTANGTVILANPNGMVFGRNSRIDVGGLIATASQIDLAPFLRQGRLTGTPGAAGAAIRSDGTIHLRDRGLAALVAPEVSESGVIVARAGRVQLAAGDIIAYDLYGDGLLSVAASPQQQKARVAQAGRIEAAGGEVVLSAAQASTLVDSAVNLDGIVEASSLSGKPGSVTLTGDHIALGASAAIRADGASGGSIQIGGGYQGRGPLPWAKTVTVAEGASLSADATAKNGAGGQAVLWSSDRTRFDGHIEAMGKGSGAGGTIETSSKHELKIGDTATVSAASPRGAAGSWLLDPGNIVIAGSGAESNVDASGAPSAYGANGGTDATIRDTTLSAALNGGSNVILQTTGANANIGASGSPSIDYTGGATRTLTLKASGNVDLSNTTIQSTGAGALNTILWADSDASSDGIIRLTGSTIATNGGFALLGGGLDNGANGGTALDGRPDNFAWGNAALGDGIRLTGSTINSGTGAITLRGHGQSVAGNSYQRGIVLENGAQLIGSSGAITLNGIGGTGTSRNYGVYLNGNGTAGGTSITTTDGAISLTGIGNGSGDYNDGIVMDAGAQIASTGAFTGTVSLNGASTGINGGNSGIAIGDANTLVTSALGAISLIGHGGGYGATNTGISIYNGAKVISTGTGATAATLTLDGTAGDGYYDWGILITGNSQLVSKDGAISVTGRGGNGAAGYSGNAGIELLGGQILSTGTGATAATVTLNGTGGNADYNDPGIWLDGSTSLISSVAGNILLNGTGGNDINTTANGIWMQNGSQILSTGTGATAANITLNGHAGTGTAANIGIDIAHSGTAIRTVDGDILLNGTGGGTQDSNSGVVVEAGAQVASTGIGAGAGTITLTGISSMLGNSNNTGVAVSGATVTSIDGAITLAGTAYGTANNNFGIGVTNGGTVSSTGTTGTAASIAMTGVSNGTGTSNDGIVTIYGSNAISSQAGNITLAGTSGVGIGNDYGITTSAPDSITTVSGAISLTGLSRGTGIADMGIGNGGLIASTGTGTVGDITLTGTGSAAGMNNDSGIGAGNISTVDANIVAVGHGGASSIGFDEYGGLMQSTGNGNITITGTAGANTSYSAGVNVRFGGRINVTNGDLLITGTGNAGNEGYGIQLYEGIINSLGTGPGAGTITLDGTGATGGYHNYGIYLQGDGTAGNTRITTVDGAVSLTGHGMSDGSSGGNYGVILDNRAQIRSTGAGTLSLTGTGGAGNGNDMGIYISNALVSSAATGAISLTGNGTGPGDSNNGIYLDNAAQIASTGSGVGAAAITLTGIGGNGGQYNIGVNSIGSITSNTGNITLTGTGGAGAAGANNGINNDGAISTGTGAVMLTGGGHGIGNVSHGISGIGNILSTGSGTVGGITLSGTGSNDGGTGNDGVVYSGTIRSNDANILLTGTGGLSGSGVELVSGLTESTAGGNITLAGTAGAGSTFKGGVQLNNATVHVTDGDLLVTGTGNAVAWGWGVFLYNGGTLSSTGTGAGAGKITVNGTGANSGGSDFGILMQDNGTKITSKDGDITLNGTGGTGGVSNHGIDLTNDADITSTGAANIVLNGIAGASGGTDVVTTGATIDLGGAGMTGNITINADTLSLANLNAQTKNMITVAPRTPGRTINVLTGAGGLDLSAATLGMLHGDVDSDGVGGLTIGSTADTATLSLGAAAWNQPLTFAVAPTAFIDVTGNQTATGGSVTSLTFNGPTHLGANADVSLASGDRNVTFGGPVTLTADSVVTAAHNGALGFGSTIDGAQNLSLFTAGNITLGGVVGGGTRLGALTVDPSSFTAGATHVGSFALTAGTGPVNFTGTGLDSNGAVSVTTNGNILGRYAGTSGSLHAGTGQVNATVTFGTLDIAGAGATLLAGNIGPLAAPASQAMANMISIGGVAAPTLVANPLYTFATYIIGATTASAGGGPSAPVAPPAVTPVPPVIPVAGSGVPVPGRLPVVPVAGGPAAGIPALPEGVTQSLANLASMFSLPSSFRFSNDLGTPIGISFGSNGIYGGGVLAGANGIGNVANILTTEGGAVDQETAERTRVGDDKIASEIPSGDSSQGLYSYRRDLIHLLGCDGSSKHPSCSLL